MLKHLLLAVLIRSEFSSLCNVPLMDTRLSTFSRFPYPIPDSTMSLVQVFTSLSWSSGSL